MSIDEREEPTIETGGEVLSIFEIMQRYRNDGSCERVIQDALRHVSLLDREAVGGAINICDPVLATDNIMLNSTDREHMRALIEGELRRWQVAYNDATTRMRDKCAEKVIAYFGGLTSMQVNRDELVAAIEALTLDQVERS